MKNIAVFGLLVFSMISIGSVLFKFTQKSKQIETDKIAEVVIKNVSVVDLITRFIEKTKCVIYFSSR